MNRGECSEHERGADPRAHHAAPASVAHDLRGPLAVIQMSVSALASRIEGTREALLIQRALKRAAGLIDALVMAAELEGADTGLEPRTTNVRTLVTEVTDDLELHAYVANVSVVVDVRSDLEAVIDPRLIARALTNLLANAIKFTRAGGIVKISATSEGDDVVFAVADTGCGIREHDVDRIFEPFWRTTKSQGGGSGMGLAIVRHVARAHRGVVSVTSRLNEGTTFVLRVPRVVRSRDDHASRPGPGSVMCHGPRLDFSRSHISTVDGLRLPPVRVIARTPLATSA